MNPREVFDKLLNAFRAKGVKGTAATSEAIKDIVVGEVKPKPKHWQGAKLGGTPPTSKDLLRKRLRKIQKQSRKRNRDT